MGRVDRALRCECDCVTEDVCMVVPCNGVSDAKSKFLRIKATLFASGCAAARFDSCPH